MGVRQRVGLFTARHRYDADRVRQALNTPAGVVGVAATIDTMMGLPPLFEGFLQSNKTTSNVKALTIPKCSILLNAEAVLPRVGLLASRRWNRFGSLLKRRSQLLEWRQMGCTFSLKALMPPSMVLQPTKFPLLARLSG